jgi:predicted dehydrogenase
MKRREFVTASAAAAGTSLLGLDARAEAIAKRRCSPSDEFHVGIIGVGSRGQHLMRLFLRIPDVRVTALCDVYEPRFAEGREITGEDTRVYRDYRRMLDAASDLDAVIVASPLGFHGEHMVASLERSLHVYGEKAMGFTVDDCNAIVQATRDSGCRFQTGLQYRYAPWYREAIERIRSGEIGRVTHVYGYWHRNYNWRRPVPDPSLERLINWRLYKEYSGGLLAELGSHQIDVANWIFDEVPTSVIGTGGITFYHDGRETFDNVQAVFTYPGGGTHVFSSIIGNHNVGYQLNIYGTGGSVKLTLEDGLRAGACQLRRAAGADRTGCPNECDTEHERGHAVSRARPADRDTGGRGRRPQFPRCRVVPRERTQRHGPVRGRTGWVELRCGRGSWQRGDSRQALRGVRRPPRGRRFNKTTRRWS